MRLGNHMRYNWKADALALLMVLVIAASNPTIHNIA
jgi:hypothetical protein